MAEKIEFVSAADLPATEAEEVDVLCVENGELKKKKEKGLPDNVLTYDKENPPAGVENGVFVGGGSGGGLTVVRFIEDENGKWRLQIGDEVCPVVSEPNSEDCAYFSDTEWYEKLVALMNGPVIALLERLHNGSERYIYVSTTFAHRVDHYDTRNEDCGITCCVKRA